MKYQIYYLKDTEQNATRLFMGADLLKKYNLFPPRAEDYELVWEESHSFDHDYPCEWIFTKFNVDIPTEFRHRSMSVGDVVVLIGGEKDGAYFCDNIGWVELPDFYKAVTEAEVTE